ncbi:hypothetical protein [Knoellia sp. Soil729]|uniref:hypothetical protein n=1 Tax=Knoellia sp. Soil729 TaxID=1736394 RepID=UPI0006F311AF|nr:hypothetical protein [Knoellia sp. Soil729]KRE41047.1 hypothetical protein ASG74_14370 [Knoellia sp. Soil729]
MSAATYDRTPLYAVPAPSEQKAQLGLLLGLRRRARQALDALLALPRGAAGWVLRHARTLFDEVSEHRILSWAASRLQDASRFLRSVGVIPLAAAVLSTPPVRRTAARWGRAIGAVIATLGRNAWTRTHRLLSRRGTMGIRLSAALANAVSMVASAVHAVTSHPAVRQLMQALSGLSGAVRPVSHSVVAHRALGLLVPTTWLRVALEVLALPLILAPAMPSTFRRSTSDPVTAAVPAHDGPPQEPVFNVPDATADSNGLGPTGDDGEQPIDLEPRNRAERRAQQQEQARARRHHIRH